MTSLGWWDIIINDRGCIGLIYGTTNASIKKITRRHDE